MGKLELRQPDRFTTTDKLKDAHADGYREARLSRCMLVPVQFYQPELAHEWVRGFEDGMTQLRLESEARNREAVHRAITGFVLLLGMLPLAGCHQVAMDTDQVLAGFFAFAVPLLCALGIVVWARRQGVHHEPLRHCHCCGCRVTGGLMVRVQADKVRCLKCWNGGRS